MCLTPSLPTTQFFTLHKKQTTQSIFKIFNQQKNISNYKLDGLKHCQMKLCVKLCLHRHSIDFLPNQKMYKFANNHPQWFQNCSCCLNPQFEIHKEIIDKFSSHSAVISSYNLQLQVALTNV